MTLVDFWEYAIKELIRSNVDRKHDFRNAVLSTNAVYPKSRYVINRNLTKDNSFLIYTDLRSAKVQELINDSSFSLLFYDKRKKLQIRVQGMVIIHTSGNLYDDHLLIARQNAKDYNSLKPPGSKLNKPEIERGQELHFCLLECIPSEWDLLLIGKEQHHRAQYTTDAGIITQSTWLVP